MDSTAAAAPYFLPFVVPICLWVAFSDMKLMKIPNVAVLSLVAVYLVVGLFALPLDEYLWRILNGLVVLAIGFVANLARAIGAGDAKFAAAAAPFFCGLRGNDSGDLFRGCHAGRLFHPSPGPTNASHSRAGAGLEVVGSQKIPHGPGAGHNAGRILGCACLGLVISPVRTRRRSSA